MFTASAILVSSCGKQKKWLRVVFRGEDSLWFMRIRTLDLQISVFSSLQPVSQGADAKAGLMNESKLTDLRKALKSLESKGDILF